MAYRFSVFTHHTKIFSLIFSKHFLLSVENKKFDDNRQSGKIKLELLETGKNQLYLILTRKEAVGENNQDMKISFYSLMLFNFLQSSVRCFKVGWAQAKAGQDIPNFWWQEKCWQNVCKVLLMWQQHFCTFCKPALTL